MPELEPVDIDRFKDSMAELAAGVSLLTVRAQEPDLDLGMTVTSLASASLDPPMVMVGIGRGTSLAPYLVPGAWVGLSILAANQGDLAREFSRKGRPPADELLAGRDHRRGPRTGALLAGGALAQVEGCVNQTIAAGDHLLVVIMVVAADAAPDLDRALIYHRRVYTEVY